MPALTHTKKTKYERFSVFLAMEASAQGCFFCRENDCRKLEYHHIRDKRRTVKALWSCAPDTIAEELAKCVVLCGSCHNALHYEERARVRIGYSPHASSSIS